MLNKNALKKFAIESRRELIEKIKLKAFQYGIEEGKIKKTEIESSDSVVVNGRPLSKIEKEQRKKLIDKIIEFNKQGEDGYKRVIEEVAYTWFNRFIALRFMEVNNYLPIKMRALSSSNPESIEPDLIKEALRVDLPVDKQRVYEMKMNNDLDGLFKYMIILLCNSLNKSLPFLFEKIGDYTELLFPDGLLNDGAFVRRLTDVNVIPEEDWKNVEIIGWMYQFYIAEEKDRVIKAKQRYKKEEIPYATQLFTPDWIVRYMVQNSLGRYWIESHPEHSDLKNEWEFYLENPNKEPDFEKKLAPFINRDLNVEDIKCFDPACGSGHILVYMFDVLYRIYEKCGYFKSEIPKLIIEKNLYGLDIDDRAYQLACFSVIMKGMEYNNKLLSIIEKEGIELNIASIQETNSLTNDDIVYIAGESSGENYEKTRELIEKFRDAKIYGSLIRIDEFDEEFFNKRLEHIMNNPPKDLMEEEKRKKVLELLPLLIKQAKIMTKTYDILVTNPPYIGNKFLNPLLSEFISKYYSDVKSDIFSAFIVYSFSKVKPNGQLGFMTPFVWMFIQSYEKLRHIIIYNKTISSLIQLEYSGFEEATVPICTFTLRNYYVDIRGEYIRLSDFPGAENQPIKTLEAIKNPNVSYRYTAYSKNFEKIPGMPIAYWVSEKFIINFQKGEKLGEIVPVRKGMDTGDNSKYLRLWHEVDFNKTIMINSNFKWVAYNKGGEFRKWYGNNEWVINWENDGFELKNSKANIRSQSFYFKQSITWSALTSSKLSFRYSYKNSIFDSAGSSFFPNESNMFYLLGLMNTNIMQKYAEIINPTLNYGAGSIALCPIFNSYTNKHIIDSLVKQNIEISKTDWDSFETSWDFKRHPLLIHKNGAKTIEEAFKNWSEFAEKQFYKLKANEEELNRIFIEIYGLQDELTPEVDEKDVTVRKADLERDIKSFISYAVGCMFGRYSLDQDGLVFAGGEFDYSKYKTFKPVEDNIIPVLDDVYFENDIVSRFVEFVKITFGEETLSENLDYIADVLGRKNGETAKDAIRRYFLNDFYKDHVQTYKKRPIYWLFTSGDQKVFNCLIYMHRYDKTLLSRIRVNYLHEFQDKLDIQKKLLIDIMKDDSCSKKEKKEAEKKLKNLEKKINELKKYDEILHHKADMQIEIDLDDGVAANYEKFKELLAPIK
ncbi:MAG: BREX-1 system adenine-specific DNA-methyltransferase PglX [Candidatus Micrarchaeota archaeon]|nr:BREX-1 system adenine-specific DNA-methyltransferase PglX [Candidatus Micrarchaeota archaeon]